MNEPTAKAALALFHELLHQNYGRANRAQSEIERLGKERQQILQIIKEIKIDTGEYNENEVMQ